MATYSLVPHPDHPPRNRIGITVEAIERGDAMLLTFMVDRKERIVFPQRVTPSRADNLWKTTCFEMFLAPTGADAYFEFNFSPSTQWAAYRFDARRAGMRDLRLDVAPRIERGDDDAGYVIKIECDIANLPRAPMRIGLSAVIEERDGTRSYWALAHAPGPPDFHNPNCFIARLPAPTR